MSSKYISLYPVLDNLKPDFTSNIKFFCVFGKDGNEVIIVTKDDKTYAFGSNYSGCLGLGHEKIVQEPTIVNELCGKQIVKIAYGYDHVIALTKCGKCFSWGDNSFGQLGQRDKKKRNRPSFINALLYETILDIQCGYSYSIVFGNSGKYFGFGFNTDGRLGCGDNNEHLLPIELVFLMKEKILSLSCGRCHSLALTENGQVLSWGNNNHGQLGFGDKMNRNTPLIIQFNDKISIKSIKACYWHSLMLSNEGIIYAFGYNSNGQLGIGNNSHQTIPLKVNASVKYKEIASYLDNNLSLAMSENGFCYVWGQCEKESFIKPEQTSFKTIHEAFAKYASVKTTYKPIWLEEKINSSKNNQELLLSESSHAIKIMKRISKLFNNEEFSDLKFKVEGKYIYVHKLILRTSCEYFRSKFSGSLNTIRESTNDNTKIDEIEIKEYSYDVYYAFLKYLYTDCIDIDPQVAVDLIILAKSYSEVDLQKVCNKILKKNITVENFCILYSKSVKYEMVELEDFCFQFALKNLNEICATKAFEEMDIISSKKFMKKVAEKRAFK